MKLTLTAFVIMTTITCALEAKAPSSQIVDSGSFGVFRTMANLAESLTQTSTLLKRGTSQPGVTAWS